MVNFLYNRFIVITIFSLGYDVSKNQIKEANAKNKMLNIEYK